MAIGIVEKGNKGLFENEIEFHGDYATYAEELKEIGAFKTLREVYLVAAVIGLNLGMKNTQEVKYNIEKSIFPAELSKVKSTLKTFYRMIMLLDERDDFETRDYVNRAFRDDSDDDKTNLKNNMDIFNAYACAGVEYLYSALSGCDTNDKIVAKLYEIYTAFCDGDIYKVIE